MDVVTLAQELMTIEESELLQVAEYLVKMDAVTAEILQDQLGVELSARHQGYDGSDYDVSESQEWHDYDPDC